VSRRQGSSLVITAAFVSDQARHSLNFFTKNSFINWQAQPMLCGIETGSAFALI
jgi:hypothetical protein